MIRARALAMLLVLAALPACAQDAGAQDAGAQDGGAQDGGGEADAFACAPAPEPVVRLDYGSRYAEDSADRSDLDEEGNAEVERALKPVDDFIIDLANDANRAGAGGEDATAAADCVLDAVAAWAEADALSELDTVNARLSAPSRLGGIAMAYLLAKPHATPDPAREAAIEGWLLDRARATAAFFDDEAPPNASRNNLRAWAGFAAAAVGRATGDAAMADWAARSVELVACQADADGALPLEMARGPRALHYQLHATAPLVVAAALLSEDGRDLWDACDGALHRIVGFAPRAFADPALVEGKAGEEQTYQTGEEELRGFELAWADAYLARFPDPALAALVDGFRPLANSKLGGAQDRLW